MMHKHRHAEIRFLHALTNKSNIYYLYFKSGPGAKNGKQYPQSSPQG